MILGELRERDEPRRQLGEHTIARDGFVARMQGREFDRNAGPARQGRIAGMSADRGNGGRIGVEILVGVGSGTRAFAQHIERITERGMAAGAGQRLVDILSDDEMRAEEPHRLSRRGAHGRLAETAHGGIENGFRRLARVNDACGDAKRPGRGRHQERGRFDVAVEPPAGGELVLDQPVRGRRIGHAQERFGEHHQRQPFLGRERVCVQEIVDAAQSGLFLPDRFHQASRASINSAFGGRLAWGADKKTCRQLLIRRSVGCLKCWQPGMRLVHSDNLSPLCRHCEEPSDAVR